MLTAYSHSTLILTNIYWAVWAIPIEPEYDTVLLALHSFFLRSFGGKPFTIRLLILRRAKSSSDLLKNAITI